MHIPRVADCKLIRPDVDQTMTYLADMPSETDEDRGSRDEPVEAKIVKNAD